jgi:membrane carboxypeptidase/penicillin-binding protein
MAALPIWMEFMQAATAGTPVQDFGNVISLDKQASSHVITVDTPDTAPTEPSEQGLPSTPSETPTKSKTPPKPPIPHQSSSLGHN